MLRKTMIMGMALALVAGFAAPAATAQTWKHHTSPIAQDQTIDLTGQFKFSGGLGSIDCQTRADLLLTAGSTTGHIQKVEPDTGSKTVTELCKAGGFLSGCQVHAVEATELPWVVHNETTRLEITSRTIDFTLIGGFCPAKTAKVTPVNAFKGHTITATPNQPKTMSSFTLTGQVLVDLYENHVTQTPFRSETATVSGTLPILDESSCYQSRPNTYSLE